MRADSEAEVVRILSEAGFWDNKRVWRLYGDRENNFSTIGNQQNRPDAALVEKLVNSVDARLMHECLARGINPESSAAPQTIREAVARFFEESASAGSVYSGQISAWDDEKRRDVARGITLAATEMKPSDGDPCITIADCGEGQTPRKFPDTSLSLEKSNKLRNPVRAGKIQHGRHGGSGVLREAESATDSQPPPATPYAPASARRARTTRPPAPATLRRMGSTAASAVVLRALAEHPKRQPVAELLADEGVGHCVRGGRAPCSGSGS